MTGLNASRLYVVGFLLLFVGLVVFAVSAGGSSSSSFGGVVFVGPFPIAFGSGPGGATLIIVSVVIAVAMVAVFLLSLLTARRMQRVEDGSYT